METTSRIISDCEHVVCAIAFVLLLSSMLPAQANYLENIGPPPVGGTVPMEMGYINIDNGNLHLEVPLGEFPQRGSTPYLAKLVYDSRIWVPTLVGPTYSQLSFRPNNLIAVHPEAGWRLETSGDPNFNNEVWYGSDIEGCDPELFPNTPTWTMNSGFTWTEPNGTVHTWGNTNAGNMFTAKMFGSPNCSPYGDVPTTSGYADDGSGLFMVVTNYFDITIYSPDGRRLVSNNAENDGTIPPYPEDQNGNYFSLDANGNVIDTLGRTPVISTDVGNNTYYDVLNPQGGRSRYTVTYETINVSVPYYSSTITVIQSIGLPNGTSYQFGYDAGTSGDNWGLVNSVTLPTGGQITYGYSTFADDSSTLQGTNRWVTSRTSGGGTWHYTPLVTQQAGNKGLCSGGVPGMQQATVTNPDGSSTVYKSAENLGTNYETDHYAPNGTLLNQEVLGYPNPCNFNNSADPSLPIGVDIPLITSFIGKTFGPSGNVLATQKTYDYTNSPSTGHPTKISEWNFYSGTAPSTPDRVRQITYSLTNPTLAGAHITGKPLTVTLSDGAGNQIAQTSFMYDNYTGNPLVATGACQTTTASQAAPAAPQHDYQNYCASNTVRGNLTQVSKWLNTAGTSITTSTNSYDDTGNLLTTKDALSNPTSMEYSLSFGLAYVTKITNAKNQVTTRNYDFNTGLLISETDPNGQTTGLQTQYTYDNMGRLIQTDLPDGGQTKTNFNNDAIPLTITTTQLATPDPSIVKYTVLDGLGRAQHGCLADPEGDDCVDSVYDQNGRLSSKSNPHRPSAAVSDGVTGFAYDGLDRPTSVTEPDGNLVSTSYDVQISPVLGETMTMTDETGRQRRTVTDAFGRLVEADEPGVVPASVNNYATLQTDGNFVLYTPGNTALWSTGTAGTGGGPLEVQDDGNLVLYKFKWQTGTYRGWNGSSYPYDSCRTGDSLFAGQTLSENQCLENTTATTFALMSNGELQMYDRQLGQITWKSNTWGNPGAYLIMQSDGNLVIYSAGGLALWASGTSGSGANVATLENDGRLIIYSTIWNSGTSQGPVSGSMAHPSCDLGWALGITGVMGTGQCFVSRNGRFELLLQTDGNLVLYDRSISLTLTPSAAIWSTATVATPFSPGIVLRTLYFYDALDNLTCVEQHGDTTGSDCSPYVMPITANGPPASDATSPWRIRRFAYDSLSRLRWSNDPESGLTTNTYDNNGNLVTETDARGVIINYRPTGSPFDPLNRVTEITYSDGTPNVNYTYDVSCCGVTSLNPIGRMVSAVAGNTELVFSYDPMGRIKTQWDCPPSGIARGYCYVISTGYDLAGQPTSLTYPDGRTVTESYNAAGHMTGVTLQSFGSTAVNAPYYTVPQSTLPSSWGYWPSGAMNRGTFGNGVIETTGYGPRLQLNAISEVKGTSTLLNRSYGLYDSTSHNNGNILSITDALNSAKNQTYSYDALNRLLTGAQADNTFNVSYSYDPWGNMKQSGTSNFNPNYDVHNRIQPAPAGCTSATAYCYDAAGNLLNDGSHVYSYDGDGRMKTVDSTVATYTYNPAGHRVRKDTPIASTEYFFFGGHIVAAFNPATSSWTDYVYAHGKRIAQDTSSDGTGAQYLHSDHIGSTRLVTDNAGNALWQAVYNAFGQELSTQNSGITFQFAGMQYDPESNLNHTDFRQYSSAEGRWLTPDPSGAKAADPKNPQSWNLYAYVLNNPISRADPTGLDPCDGSTVAAPVAVGPYVFDEKTESQGDGPDPCLTPPPSPPDIDPCAGKSDECVQQEAATNRAAAADLLAYLAFLRSGCMVALRTADTNVNAVQRANSSWPTLQQAGAAHDVNPKALAALGVRESGFRNIYGDYGHGRGTFQIDDRGHREVTDQQAFDPKFAANFAAGLLNSNFNTLFANFGNFTEMDLAQATFASYNFGTGNISGNPNTIDVGTAHNNYGANTLAILTNCF